MSRRGKVGSAAVEALFLILLFATLFFGAVEIGRAVALKQSLDSGVAEAARGLSLDPGRWDWAEGVIRAEVDRNVVAGGYGSQVIISALDVVGNPVSPESLAGLGFGSEFRVHAELVYQSLMPFVSLAQVTLRADHFELVERYP